MTVDCEYIYNLLLEKADLCNKSNKYFNKKWAKIHSELITTYDDYTELYYYLKCRLNNNRNFIFRMRSIIENKKLKIYFYIKPIDYMRYSMDELKILNIYLIKIQESNNDNDNDKIELKVMKYNLIKYNKLKKVIRRLNEYLYYKDIFEIIKKNNNIYIYAKKIK
jgi:hypothetical protein